MHNARTHSFFLCRHSRFYVECWKISATLVCRCCLASALPWPLWLNARPQRRAYPQDIQPQLHQLGYKDKAWSVNKLGAIAYRHALPETAITAINTLYGHNSMEVSRRSGRRTGGKAHSTVNRVRQTV